MKHEPTEYDRRYKHKLNMLEPGMKMIKATGILLAAAAVLYAVKLKAAAYIAAGLAGAVFLVLVLLLIIEAHQDRVLNEIAEREKKDD